MKYRKYCSQVEAIIEDSPIVTHFSIDCDEIDTEVYYLKGMLELIDGSLLYFIEFVEIQDNTSNRLKYKYHWQSENGNLIARWDNVPHHKEIDTFPHHMHDDKGVHAFNSMNLGNIIDIIMDKIII